jgi:hypothetical protein
MSAAVWSVLDADAPDMSNAVAWTNYLRGTLRHNKGFVRKCRGVTTAGKTSSKKGLGIGRYNDHVITKYYPNPGKPRKKVTVKDRRAIRTIKHLEQDLGLTDIVSQYPIVLRYNNSHAIKTKIDLVGFKNNIIVVIELKNTQFTLADHEKIYSLNCGAARLSNLLPDSEEVHHQLQCALGVLGLQERIKRPFRVVGRVVLSGEDGVKSYGCDNAFLKRSHFNLRPNAVQQTQPNVKLMRMPEDPGYHAPIMVTLKNSPLRRFTRLLDHNHHGCIQLQNVKTEEIALVAIISDPNQLGATTKKYKNARTHLITMATNLKTTVLEIRCAILSFASGSYTYHGIRGKY